MQASCPAASQAEDCCQGDGANLMLGLASSQSQTFNIQIFFFAT